MEKIIKADITNKIFEHFKDSKVPKRDITKAVFIIVEQIIKELVENRSVTVDGFGTFSSYFRQIHRAFNCSTRDVRMLPGKKSIKFFPHYLFMKLLKDRRSDFMK